MKKLVCTSGTSPTQDQEPMNRTTRQEEPPMKRTRTAQKFAQDDNRDTESLPKKRKLQRFQDTEPSKTPDTSENPRSTIDHVTKNVKEALTVRLGSSINRLSDEEVEETFKFYEKKYEIENDDGCYKLGKDKKTRKYMTPKANGYLMISPQRSEKKKKPEKILWHQLCWRYHNNCERIPYDCIIHQRCGNHLCGDKTHLGVSHKNVPLEEHKQCEYFFTRNVAHEYLHCEHQPCCIPPRFGVKYIFKPNHTWYEKESREPTHIYLREPEDL